MPTFSYSLYIHVLINGEKPAWDQVDFPAGTTPVVPQVGDEIGFTDDGASYWMTVEERFFEYTIEDREHVTVWVCLLGRISSSSEAPRGRRI